MSEHGQQPCPAARASAFHGAGGYVEDASRLGHGVALHIDQYQCGSLIDGELCQRGQELAVEILTLGRGLGGFMRFEELLEALGVVDRGGFPRGRLTRPVKTGVHGDAMKPCGDGGLPAEGVGSPEGRDQSVLDCVRGLLAVAQSAQRDGPEPVAVAPYELTEGVGVPRDMAGQKILVACVAECHVVQR